jgi:Zn-dependent protease
VNSERVRSRLLITVHRYPLTDYSSPSLPLSDFILSLPVLLFSLVAHEYAHARTALWQGDDTGLALGRVTLNPLPHIDPWMTVLLPALLWFTTSGNFLFGGAKPVPVSPRKYRHYVRGDLIVSSAGVVTNFFLAFGCALLFVGLGALGGVMPGMGDGLAILQRMMLRGIWLNMLLCVFNLIPIPPLDGSHLLYHALPPTVGARYRSIGQFGFIPLFVLMVFFSPVLNFLLGPAQWGFWQLYNLVHPFGIGELWDFTRG